MPRSASAIARADPRVEAAVARRPPLRRRPGRGLLVGLSGMDGSGKSSAVEAVVEQLRAHDVPVKVNWHRLGEMQTLDDIAEPVKRVVRPRRPVAAQGAAGLPRRRGPVAWLWVLLVALVTARWQMQSTGLTHRGVAVVCDRWRADALVDLEIRYGRHRAAEWLLTASAPNADVELLLDIDADTSVRRKPEDQPRARLERMERAYERAARATRVQRIDARRPQAEVLADIRAAVDAALAAKARR